MKYNINHFFYEILKCHLSKAEGFVLRQAGFACLFWEIFTRQNSVKIIYIEVRIGLV